MDIEVKSFWIVFSLHFHFFTAHRSPAKWKASLPLKCINH